MKNKLLLLMVLGIGILNTLSAPKIDYSFNRIDNTLNLSFPVKTDFNYSLIRYDIKNNYYDVYTNFTSSVSDTNTIVVNPLLPSDVGQPTPSGQCYFYLIEQE